MLNWKSTIIIMKRLHFLRLVLITITAVALIASFGATYNDDEPTVNVLCINNVFLIYINLLLDPASCKGIRYEYNNVFVYPDVFISYLASKEKSPPRNNI